MKSYQVGISVLTENIPEEVVNRFFRSVEFDAKPRVSYVLLPISNKTVNMYTEYNGKTYFNRNKGHNFGIKTLASICEIIICADIDLLIPEGYIDTSYYSAIRNVPLSGVMRNIEKYESIEPRRWFSWMRNHRRDHAFGPWNALKAEHWYKVGGWNENLFSWGMDIHMWKRIKRKFPNAIRYDERPLMHVHHPKRNKPIKDIAPEVKRKVEQTINMNFLEEKHTL